MDVALALGEVTLEAVGLEEGAAERLAAVVLEGGLAGRFAGTVVVAYNQYSTSTGMYACGARAVLSPKKV